MVRLEQEQNIEVLREHAVVFRDEIKRLANELAELRGQKSVSDQEWLSVQLKDQLVRLRKKFFGFGQERLPGSEPRPVGHEQQQLLFHTQRAQPEEKERAKSSSTKDELSKQAIEYEFSDEELATEARLREVPGEKEWVQMKNFFQESSEITVIERIYKKVIHRQAKYRLKDEYNTTGKEVIITAPGPVKLVAGCQYSVDFALSVVSDKYEYHLPLERQRRQMEAQGLDIDVKTLYSLCARVAEHCEKFVLPKIKRDITADFCAVHLDESPWPIIGQGNNSYMWVLSNRLGSHYVFEPTRSGKIAREILKGYEGSVLTDAYSGYNRIKVDPNIRLGHCWSHVRREFFERYDDYPTQVTEILKLIDGLFKIEGQVQDADGLRQLRTTLSKPLVDKIADWLWATKMKFLPKEGISSAINYCLGHWKELTLFLSDLSIPLSNNDAERSLRHIVMGRKNFMGSKTINGADTAAILYTVIETAKKVGLQPREYLKYVITENWHKREPKSPLEYSIECFGGDNSPVFPPKSEWRVQPLENSNTQN